MGGIGSWRWQVKSVEGGAMIFDLGGVGVIWRVRCRRASSEEISRLGSIASVAGTRKNGGGAQIDVKADAII